KMNKNYPGTIVQFSQTFSIVDKSLAKTKRIRYSNQALNNCSLKTSFRSIGYVLCAGCAEVNDTSVIRGPAMMKAGR
ncbi:MAG: hypothetical protein IJ091_06565, partial [Oscillospiraceae bacterium]|nr:hypothetical protein [Oscillospiraceae bacterium]